jgi:hypothetical protein
MMCWQCFEGADLSKLKVQRFALSGPNGLNALLCSMFSLNKQLSRHCKSSHAIIGTIEGPKAKKRKADSGKKSNGGGGGFTLPQQLSPELSELLGVPTASRGECMKLLWAYIKEHDLQDPNNKATILVAKDEKLHKVLQVDECRGFSMSKHLKGHFLGRAATE